MSVMNKWRNDPEYREKVSKGQQKQKVKQQIASHLTSEQLQQRRQLLQRGYELLRKAEIAANAIKAKSANGEDIADETIQRYDDAVHRARSSVESLEDNVRWLEESMCEYASEVSGSNSHDADYSHSQTEEGNREVAAAFASR
jgi:seryl-tRNA synthetase